MSDHESWAAKMWHSLLAYLDSCPFLPLFTWEHWSELAPLEEGNGKCVASSQFII